MLGPGEEMRYSKDWNLIYNSGDPMPPGIYQLKATIIINTNLIIESEPLDIEVQGHELDIFLYKGWNFISLPCMPVYSDMSIILKSIWPHFKSIWTNDVRTKSWIRYIVGGSYYFNNLKTMEIGKGYWIEVSQDTILHVVGRFIQDPRIVLRSGWNLVGFNSANLLPLNQIMGSISYKSINTYENIENKWLGQWPQEPQILNGLDHLEPGKGYCIYVNSDCIWDIRVSGL